MSDLGIKLFRRIQKMQGYAFISNSVEDMDDVDVIKIARGSLMLKKECVNILEKFLSDYDN